MYALYRIRGRLVWVHEPFQRYDNPKIIDPRSMLRVLAPYARFQASGYQVIGGVRLKVLRATDPGGLTRRGLLPVMYTSGQSVGSLAVWVDGQGVVHRMAFTFRGSGPDHAQHAGEPGRAAELSRVQRAAARTMKRLAATRRGPEPAPQARSSPPSAARQPGAAARLPDTAGIPR